MPYLHINFIQCRTQLAQRLGDSGKVFWTDAELGLYVKEALRTWAGHTAYWRDRKSFSTATGTAFYDLSVQCAALCAYNLTDQDAVNDLQYSLMEPANNWASSTAWAGTSMFTMADLVNALQRRRDQFLKDTGAVLANATLSPGPPPVNLVQLPDNVIDLRRIAWKDAQTGGYTPLFRDSEFALNSYLTGWSVNPAVPIAYSVAASPPVTVRLAPAPLSSGTLDVTTVNAGAALDVTSGVALGVPDNFAWAVKWGALADLLSRDGPARDAQRADYAEQRWLQGVELARMAPSVMNAQINGQDVHVDTLYNLDTYNPAWQSIPGVPTAIGLAGLNLLAISPTPNSGAYSITVDVARNAPVPAADTDAVQIGREDLDVLLDYAEHLAMFKCGGAEFAETMPLWERFVKAAGVYNDRLASWSPLGKQMEAQGQNEARRNPRRQSDKLVTTLVGG